MEQKYPAPSWPEMCNCSFQPSHCVAVFEELVWIDTAHRGVIVERMKLQRPPRGGAGAVSQQVRCDCAEIRFLLQDTALRSLVEASDPDKSFLDEVTRLLSPGAASEIAQQARGMRPVELIQWDVRSARGLLPRGSLLSARLVRIIRIGRRCR